MPEQLNLLEIDGAASPPTPDVGRARRGEPSWYTLFLAIFPQPGDTAPIAQRADELRQHHRLAGRRLETGRLHVSLHGLGNFSHATPQAVIDATIAGAAAVVCPPLHLVFDRALSFAGSNAFALRCNAGSDEAVARLRQSLALALRRVGLRPEPSRTPHMTLLYDRHRVAEHAIEPIGWSATEFVLVLSHVGQTHHRWLARWPLGPHG